MTDRERNHRQLLAPTGRASFVRRRAADSERNERFVAAGARATACARDSVDIRKY
jgi:hypothetical protein